MKFAVENVFEYLVVMLKYRKNLVSVCIDTLMKSIDTCAIQHYIKEISNKLKRCFERNVRNVLETLITNFWNILIMILCNLLGKFEWHFRNKYLGDNTNWF